MKRIYSTFYLAGHADLEENSVDADVDLIPLANKVIDGGELLVVAHDAAKKVMSPFHLTDKREFVDLNKTEIKDAGGDERLAFNQWMAGRTDAYAIELAENILDTMEEVLGEEFGEAATPEGDDADDADDEADDEEEPDED